MAEIPLDVANRPADPTLNDATDGMVLPQSLAIFEPPPRWAPPPELEELLSYFEYDHLPPHLQAVSLQFHTVAHRMVDTIDDGRALRSGLDWLTLAKDSFVRAKVREARGAVQVEILSRNASGNPVVLHGGDDA